MKKVGADAEMVRIGMSTDTRIGNRFLFPGIGYGGSCFPKDIEALINTGNEYGCEMPLVKSVNRINRLQRELFVKRLRINLARTWKVKYLESGAWHLSQKQMI